MIFHAARQKESMQPEAVAPSLKAADEFRFDAVLEHRLGALLRDQRLKRVRVAGFQVSKFDLLVHGPLRRDEPGRRAELNGHVDDVTVGGVAGHGKAPELLDRTPLVCTEPVPIASETKFQSAWFSARPQDGPSARAGSFLNASTISPSWAGCLGRALMWERPIFFRSVPMYRSQ